MQWLVGYPFLLGQIPGGSGHCPSYQGQFLQVQLFTCRGQKKASSSGNPFASFCCNWQKVAQPGRLRPIMLPAHGPSRPQSHALHALTSNQKAGPQTLAVSQDFHFKARWKEQRPPGTEESTEVNSTHLHLSLPLSTMSWHPGSSHGHCFSPQTTWSGK